MYKSLFSLKAYILIFEVTKQNKDGQKENREDSKDRQPQPKEGHAAQAQERNDQEDHRAVGALRS